MALHLSHLWCEEAVLFNRVFSLHSFCLFWDDSLHCGLFCPVLFLPLETDCVTASTANQPPTPLSAGQLQPISPLLLSHPITADPVLVHLHSLWQRSPASQTCCLGPVVWLLLDAAFIEHLYMCVPFFAYFVGCVGDFWH